MLRLPCLGRLLIGQLLLLTLKFGCWAAHHLSCPPAASGFHTSHEIRSFCLALPALQINDRYEFPEQLDLDYGDRRFLAQEADQSVRNVYKLHSVLVHSGGVHGGHYYAFIRPDGKQWLKFDDDKVSTVQAPALLFSGRTFKATCTCMGCHPQFRQPRHTLPRCQHCTSLTRPQPGNQHTAVAPRPTQLQGPTPLLPAQFHTDITALPPAGPLASLAPHSATCLCRPCPNEAFEGPSSGCKA